MAKNNTSGRTSQSPSAREAATRYNQDVAGKLDRATGLAFLKTEVEVGLTFAGIARDAAPGQTDKIQRNLGHARQAYDAIRRFRPLVDLSYTDGKDLDAGVERLRKALVLLGEQV